MFNIIKFAFVLFLGVISCACVNIVAIHELNQKANDYLQKGDIDAAISRLEASVDLDGNIYESRYNLAAAYMQKNECEKALKHIEIAFELNKKQPNIPYTHAVALMCVADSLFEKTNENGEAVTVEFSSIEEENSANVKYVELLSKANESFEIYLNSINNENEIGQIKNIIVENNQKIAEKEKN